jgi:hypothetical protein
MEPFAGAGLEVSGDAISFGGVRPTKDEWGAIRRGVRPTQET